MGYRNLLECVRDLEAQKELVRINEPIDPHLEMAEIQRRVFRAGGPALLFTCPKDCRFPMLGNLFGTMERMRYLFRDTLDGVKQLVKLQVDPLDLLAAADELPQCPLDGLACLAQTRKARPRAGVPDDHRPASATQVLARRRRGLRHTAAGLYGRSPQPGPDAFQPGHVSRAAQRRPLRAQSRCRAALSDPSRHRRAPLPRPWN